MVKVGEKVENFKVTASNGEEVQLSDFHGKYVVLYFYPKDMTPGCTTEACSFRDQHTNFADLDAVILGVSGDPLDKHKKFVEKHGLPFLLLVDDDQQLAKYYDVLKPKKMFGKEFIGIERSTFLIDKEGKLVKEWRKVKVNGHVEEVLNFIKTM
ncbi:thioredoxin-dependent thiol peroxidase [Bacillus kwashiorkori]|uniref:thioredoxin-dependent thiol peroxidase n=1 Tax=Bacillus kwashiorkori TaxID=1522318 RepID=UPI000A8A94F8